MNSKKWPGIMKVLEIQHIRNQKVIWGARDIRNMLHLEGEQYMLKALFAGTPIPAAYYLGLDARPAIASDNTLLSLVGEPSGDGYVRQAVLPNSLEVTLVSGKYRATTSVLAFTATSNTWGPVTNLFMATSSDGSGSLIGTAELGQQVIVLPGDSVLMRMALSLGDAGV